MFDFTKETREDLVLMFRDLEHSLERHNRLPHEMVAMSTIKSNEKDAARFKAFWAEYLEYLAKLVREASPFYP